METLTDFESCQYQCSSESESLLEIPLDKEHTADCHVEIRTNKNKKKQNEKKKIERIDPGCTVIDVGKLCTLNWFAAVFV